MHLGLTWLHLARMNYAYWSFGRKLGEEPWTCVAPNVSLIVQSHAYYKYTKYLQSNAYKSTWATWNGRIDTYSYFRPFSCISISTFACRLAFRMPSEIALCLNRLGCLIKAIKLSDSELDTFFHSWHLKSGQFRRMLLHMIPLMDKHELDNGKIVLIAKSCTAALYSRCKTCQSIDEFIFVEVI